MPLLITWECLVCHREFVPKANKPPSFITRWLHIRRFRKEIESLRIIPDESL
jgi:hypothetical protein